MYNACFDSIYDKVKSNPRRKSAPTYFQKDASSEDTSSNPKKRRSINLVDRAKASKNKITVNERLTEIKKSDLKKIQDRIAETQIEVDKDGDEIITYVVYEKLKGCKSMRINLPVLSQRYLRLANKGLLKESDLPKKYDNKIQAKNHDQNTRSEGICFALEVDKNRMSNIQNSSIQEMLKIEREALKRDILVQKRKSTNPIFQTKRQDSLISDLEMSSSSDDEQSTPDRMFSTESSSHRTLSKSDSGNDECLKKIEPSVLDMNGKISPDVLAGRRGSTELERRLIDEAFEISSLLHNQ